MRNPLFLLAAIIIFSLISCKKDNSNLQRNSIPVVLASNLDVSKDFLPDTMVAPFMKCVPAGSQVACGMVDGQFDLDLNGDKKIDFTFSTPAAQLHDINNATYLYISDTSFQIVISPKGIGDSISNQSNWASSTPTQRFRNRYCLATALTYITPGIDTAINEWTDFKYLAFRRATKNDTLFGWIKLKITDFHSLTIDSYSMQK